MADSSFKLELSWQSPWGSEKREGRALLPQGREGGGGGGVGGDSHRGRSPGYGLKELTNTKKRVGPRRAVTPRADTTLQKALKEERETDEGLEEGSMDRAQALQRSNQTSSEEEEAGSSLFHRILEQRQLRNPDEEMVS